MATPSAVTSVYTDALISTFDIQMPSIKNTLFRRFGDQGLGFYQMMDTLGYIEPVAQTTYSHFEEDWIHVPVHVLNTVASPGAGNPISFTLQPQDLDVNNKFYIQLQHNVIFNNQVTGTVTAINVTTPTAPIITVQPHDATDNIGSVIAGDTVVIYSSDFAEGTDQPAGQVARTIKYTFSTKISKVSNEYTGSEATNQLWFDKDSAGNSIPAYYVKGQLDTDYRMSLAAGDRTTTGVVPWVRGGGNVDTYLSGFYSMADFDYQNNILDQNFAPNEEVAMLGFKLQTDWDNLFSNSFVNGALVYGMFKEGQKSIDLAIGFNTFSKTERIWHIKRMAGFNHPQTYGAPGYNISGMGVIMPMDGRKDPKSNDTIPSFGQVYKSLGGYDRKMKVWLTGGAKASTNTIDKDVLSMRSEYGTRFVASNRFFLVEEQ